MITSTKNDQVKAVIELKKKARARNEQGLFVVEGVRMAAELPKDQVKSIYVSETFAKNPENAAILAEYPGYELVSDSVFAVMSDTQTPQGVLALVRQFSYGMDELLKSDRPAHLMVLENLQDPGNLGTILRAGEGAGITGLIMSRDTVDIYNPKVIRSTAGSLFHLPVVTMGTDEYFDWCAERGLAVYAADVYGIDARPPEPLTDVLAVPQSLSQAKTVLFGNEARGLDKEVLERADRIVSIPIYGRAESLNLGTSAAVMLLSLAMSSHVERM